MLTMVILAFLATQTAGVATNGAATPVDAEAMRDVKAEPDFVTRGQTTTVVVAGSNLDELKTLRISPVTGLRVGVAKPLEARADGMHAVSISITVTALARAGDRDLTVLPAPATAPIRRVPVGTIRVNTHDVTISSVEVVGSGADTGMRVIVTDEKYDVVANDPSEVEMDAALLEVPEPLVLRAMCSEEPVKVSLDGSTIEKRDGPSVTLLARLHADALDGRTGCELAVRARDSQGNISSWTRILR